MVCSGFHSPGQLPCPVLDGHPNNHSRRALFAFKDHLMRTRHTPIRTCVACRTSGDKRGLLRVVRKPEGGVEYDTTGKANGRGAYVCASETCIKAAQKQNKLGRSLKSEVGADLYEELLNQAKSSQAE